MAPSAGLGPLCAFLASATWALGSSAYSKISRGHSAFAINFTRAMLALPLFVVASSVACGGPARSIEAMRAVPSADWGWLALSILSSYGMGDVLFMWSTRSLGVPAALAIGSTYPLLTAGLGALYQGEALSGHRIAGLMLSVAGVVTVILSQAQPTPASSHGAHAAPSQLTRKSVGVWLAFATMLSWAINSVGTERGGHSMDPMTANVFRMFCAVAMSLAFGRVFERGRVEIALPWHVLRRYLPIFVIEAFGGSAFFMYGLSHSPLAIGSTLSSLAPVLAVPVAWSMGLERLSWPRTLGVAAVVGGIALLFV